MDKKQQQTDHEISDALLVFIGIIFLIVIALTALLNSISILLTVAL